MVQLLITADFQSMMQLAEHINDSGLMIDRHVQGQLSDNNSTEYVVKFSCEMVEMFTLFHTCGKAGINLNVKILYNQIGTAEAVCYKI